MRAWLSYTSWKVPKWADTFSLRDSATPYSMAREAGLLLVQRKTRALAISSSGLPNGPLPQHLGRLID